VIGPHAAILMSPHLDIEKFPRNSGGPLTSIARNLLQHIPLGEFAMPAEDYSQNHVISSDSRFAVVRDLVKSLVDGIGRRCVSSRELALIAELLETLPLTTAFFSLSKRRLLNARRYLESAEFGAASYELRLLHGMLSAPPTARTVRRRSQERENGSQ
jgi:hypothetical protein